MIPLPVVTGIGVVSPIGVGKEAFWASLTHGQCGIRPVTLFDTARLSSHLAGEIAGFCPEAILGSKGLRLLDRSTKLALCAAALAMEDAGVDRGDPEVRDYGVVLGTTMGSMASRGDFYKTALVDGWRGVNPALFPNTVVNSPASQVAIRFGIRGLNATISTGLTSGLDSLMYAADMIRLGRAHKLLVGAVEELAELSYALLCQTGFLSRGGEGSPERSIPFDRRRNGAVAGEGAAMFVLEAAGHAQARGARPYATYLGGASAVDHRAHNRYSLRAAGAAKAITDALAEAGVRPDQVDYVAASANSTLVGDAAEARALHATLGADGRPVVASAVASAVGETLSASAALQTAAALLSLDRQVIPPTLNVTEPDPRCPVDCVPREARPAIVSKAMVTSVSPAFQNSACVFGRDE